MISKFHDINKKLIKDYPDFPKEGILFKDILPIFQNPEAFEEVVKIWQIHQY